MCYSDVGQRMIIGFKYYDRTFAAPTFAAWLFHAGKELLAEAGVIVPMPLHRWRMFGRRFNQAAVLALRLADLSGVPAVPDVLRRVRATPSQVGLIP